MVMTIAMAGAAGMAAAMVVTTMVRSLLRPVLFQTISLLHLMVRDPVHGLYACSVQRLSALAASSTASAVETDTCVLCTRLSCMLSGQMTCSLPVQATPPPLQLLQLPPLAAGATCWTGAGATMTTTMTGTTMNGATMAGAAGIAAGAATMDMTTMVNSPYSSQLYPLLT